MAVDSANRGKADRDEWLERKVMHYGVEIRGVRYNSDELINLRLRRVSLRVAVRLANPDGSAILVRVPRRKSILSVPAISSVPLCTSKKDGQ
jgi:hypothetical protein